jgi:hypothetical protein
MGVWGMANLLGRAVGSLMGGAIVDGIQLLSGNAFSAYAVVFALEAVMLGISLVLSFRLQIEGALAQQEAQEFELASATAN